MRANIFLFKPEGEYIPLAVGPAKVSSKVDSTVLRENVKNKNKYL